MKLVKVVALLLVLVAAIILGTGAYLAYQYFSTPPVPIQDNNVYDIPVKYGAQAQLLSTTELKSATAHITIFTFLYNIPQETDMSQDSDNAFTVLSTIINRAAARWGTKGPEPGELTVLLWLVSDGSGGMQYHYLVVMDSNQLAASWASHPVSFDTWDVQGITKWLNIQLSDVSYDNKPLSYIMAKLVDRGVINQAQADSLKQFTEGR